MIMTPFTILVLLAIVLAALSYIYPPLLQVAVIIGLAAVGFVPK